MSTDPEKVISDLREIFGLHAAQKSSMLSAMEKAQSDFEQASQSANVNGNLYERALRERDEFKALLEQTEKEKLDNAQTAERAIEKCEQAQRERDEAKALALQRQNEALDLRREVTALAAAGAAMREALERIAKTQPGHYGAWAHFTTIADNALQTGDGKAFLDRYQEAIALLAECPGLERTDENRAWWERKEKLLNDLGK
jgi:hypothetical protein